MKQAFRIISRMKGYTALSLLGLIISLSGTVIIARYLHQEWTIDSWMPERERICQVSLAMWDDENSGNPTYSGSFRDLGVQQQMPLSEIDGLEAVTEVYLRSLLTVKLEDEKTFTVNAISADSDFVRVFPLQAAEGTLDLKAYGNAIISQSLARKLFPGESAVGRTFTMDNDLHTVTGVFREPSTKSTYHFDLVNNSNREGWFNNTLAVSFVKLKEGWSRAQFNKQQTKKKIFDDWREKEILGQYELEPFQSRRFDFIFNNDWPSVNKPSSPSHLWMLFAVAVLLFLVGVFNFLNLYAVMWHTRNHEMAVRRIFGASRWDIFCQLYAETFMLALLTMIGVWTVVELMEPLLATYYNIEVLAQRKFDVALTVAIVFGLPLISSMIPNRSGHSSLGEGLVVGLQFFISMTLITVSIYMMRQLHAMMTSDPGYQTENIISCLPFTTDMYSGKPRSNELSDKMLFRQRMQEYPYVIDFCVDKEFKNNSFHVTSEGGTEMELMGINEHVINVLGLEMLEGRCLCDSLDSQAPYHCIINETALKRLGLKNWRTEEIPFNYFLYTFVGLEQDEYPTYQIVGIVKDFHPKKLSEPQPAIMFTYDKDKYDIQQPVYYIGSSEQRTLVRIEPGHEREAVKFLKKVEKEVFGKNDLDYHWFSDEVKAMYEEDRRTARIFFTFSFLAIAVTCLGVLGLMMFDVRRRYREIALRKVNGATFLDIALLLSRRYLIILAVAAAVSIPVSLIGLHQLITRYYTIHATIAWWIPLVSIAIVLLLCALTLWQQVWKATRIRPYEVLKEQ